MEIVFKDSQIAQISSHLNITKTSVHNILTEYISYLRNKISNGESIKFLNVCYLRVDGQVENTFETLAYIANEIGQRVGQQQPIVYRVLTTYEEFLIKDLRKLNSYSIRGLIRIKLEKDYKGNWVVRTKKSTVYNGHDIYVTTMPSFKRKAEVVA